MTHAVSGKSWLRTALRTSAATGALIAGMTLSAYAQDEAPPPEAEAESDDTIIVTGSRIPVASNLEASSPITQLNSDEFTMRGTSKVEDIVNTLPQAFAAQGSNVSNGASGTAQVDLRNLGADRTLVLIDGRRMAYGNAPFDTAADLNQIPAALVDRVEVVTGGASAVYGSDAMSGVVNFIMKRDFEGLRFDGQFSFYQHDNNNELALELLDAEGIEAPDESVLDGFGKDFSVVAGTNFDQDRGNVTVYFTYHHNNEIIQENRDYSKCAVGAGFSGGVGPDEFICFGSGTTAEGTFFPVSSPVGDDLILDPVSGELVPREGRTYNYAPPNHYVRPDERFLFGTFTHYEINEYADVYFDVMYHDDRSQAQIAPSGSFFGISQLNCGNPLMSNQFATAIGCSAADITNDNFVTVFVGKRNVEGGNRFDDLRHTSFRGVFGVRGETGIEGFTYDVFGSWSNVHVTEIFNNDLSFLRMGRALDVVSDINGDPQCRSAVGDDLTLGTFDSGEVDSACVPWNIFQPGQANQFGALSYIGVPAFSDANTTQQMASGAITIDMAPYDGRSPWAKDAIGMVLGAEYRRDTLDFDSDISFCDRGDPPNTDLSGQGGPSCPVSGAQEVYEGFVEMRLPLIQGRELIHDLTGEFGYRYSTYEFGGATHTWKLLGNFSPTQDVRFRGGWQRAVRAPNVIELFLPERIALFNFEDDDPCSTGASNPATPAQCANSGAFAYPVLSNPAGQYNQRISGNADLEPETADTYTIGAVLTPGFAPKLVLSVDWFDIKVENFIDSLDPESTVNKCVFDGNPFACSLVHRESTLGTLWLTGSFVDAQNINTGFLWTRGIDITANYGFDFEDLGAAGWGSMSFDFVGTWLEKLDVEPLPGDEIVECVGFHSDGNCDEVPVPEWRHKFRAVWSTPIQLDLAVSWRYFGGTQAATSDFPVVHYLDIATRYQLLDNLALRAGVNNILDRDPPFTEVGAGFGNGNTYPQFYDCCGRYFFFSATVDF